MSSLLSWAQLSKEYEVTTAVSLSTLVSSEKNTITDLTLTGTLDATDFVTIRSMTALQNLNLDNVNLVDNTLPAYAFSGKKLNQLLLPKTLKTIEREAFVSSNIKELSLPSTLETIAQWFFFNATIDKLDFSNTPKLTSIGRGAFNNITLTSGQELDFSHNSKLANFPLSPESNGPRSAFCNFKGEVILPN